MKHQYRPNTLANAPVQCAPHNELGVVFLFAHIAKRLQLRIEEIRPAFPDCIAYKRMGGREKRVRIEFKFKSSKFLIHEHNPRECDCIVCWHHDWPDVPRRIQVIELRHYFGAAPKVWIQPVIRSQWCWLDKYDQQDWALSKKQHQETCC